MKTFLKAILLPFLFSRLLLLIVGYASPSLVPIAPETGATTATRGWLFSAHRYVDIWARWDSGWYLDIAKDGYRMGHDVYTMSNLAFYPTYPYLIKIIAVSLAPDSITNELIIAIGAILSNLFLVASLTLMYQLSLTLFGSKRAAENSVWLLLLFPTSFFLSSVYTESMFLFFSLLSIWFATKPNWLRSSLSAAIATATRPVGVLIILPLTLIYLSRKKWQIQNLDRQSLWLLLIPSGVIGFFTYLYFISGDFLAAIKVQSAWGKNLADPFKSLITPTGYWAHITPFDQVVVVAAVVSSFLMIKHPQKKLLPLGLYSLLLTIPTLFTGTLDSSARFVLVAFPLFLYWAEVFSRHQKMSLIVKVIFLTLQLGYFALFTQFYWVG